MIKHPLTQLRTKTCRLFMPNIIFAHTKVICPPAQETKGSKTPKVKMPDFKRAEKSAPCRFGFIPENWFGFFHPKTGVTGPYVFGILFINYLVSKEIFVLEHEYYSGLSIALVLYVAVTKFGPEFSVNIDNHVDAVEADLEKKRQDEIKICEDILAKSKEAQWRAEGQKILMDAKKECIAIQLELAYRRRVKEAFDIIKGRLKYQAKKYRIEKRLQQTCLVEWVLKSVHKSITPEFRKQSLERAIQDLAIAGHGVGSTLFTNI